MVPVVKVEEIITILNSENPQDVNMGMALYENLRIEMEDNGLVQYYTSKPYVMLQLSNKDINPNAKWSQGLKGHIIVLKRNIKNKEYIIDL